MPNAERAFIHPDKITRYELEPEHDEGGDKARYFIDHGFSLEQPEQLRDALLQHAHEHEVVRVESTRYGVQYIIEGEMEFPDGGVRRVRSVWQIDTDTDYPRLISAYRITR